MLLLTLVVVVVVRCRGGEGLDFNVIIVRGLKPTNKTSNKNKNDSGCERERERGLLQDKVV